MVQTHGHQASKVGGDKVLNILGKATIAKQCFSTHGDASIAG